MSQWSFRVLRTMEVSTTIHVICQHEIFTFHFYFSPGQFNLVMLLYMNYDCLIDHNFHFMAFVFNDSSTYLYIICCCAVLTLAWLNWCETITPNSANWLIYDYNSVVLLQNFQDLPEAPSTSNCLFAHGKSAFSNRMHMTPPHRS